MNFTLRLRSFVTLLFFSFWVALSAFAQERIAFMADVHFHDVFGTFQDGSFEGLAGKDGKKATIRTMMAQLTSTRLFNENYFAFRAALDDAAKKGIKLIVLAGDFSDDGQPVHMRGLVAVLNEYEKKHGMKFFATFGNHDPVKPFTSPGGKADFLGPGGKNQKIASRGASPETKDYTGPWASIPVPGQELPTIATEEIRYLGYQELMEYMGPFGLMPQRNYLYWETPYSSYNENNYSFAKAQSEASFEKRQYRLSNKGFVGIGAQPTEPGVFSVFDGTYLVEPVKDVWLVAVDANVYIPTDKADSTKPTDPANFSGSGDTAWNKMITHKTHVIEWLKGVVNRAKAKGKRLVVFNHYPMNEFYKNANEEIAAIFGPSGLDLKRKPQEATVKALAELGVELNFAGHMHYNDTGVYRDGKNFMVNVQVPSLAAYVPAYKVLTFTSPRQVTIDTVVLKEVPDFNKLFEHYETEYRYLVESKAKALWNQDVLKSANYLEFANWHMAELTRLRFLKSNWPSEMRTILEELSLADFIRLACLDSSLTLAQVQGMGDLPPALVRASFPSLAPARGNVAVGADDRTKLLQAWLGASKKASDILATEGLRIENYEKVPAITIAVDFHRMMNAGELSWDDVGERLKLYRVLRQVINRSGPAPLFNNDKALLPDSSITSVIQHRFQPVFEAMMKTLIAPPNKSFTIDFERQKIEAIADKPKTR
ncbi:MAG TPA: metallophosphoesterase [Termitinemataceae bacterium]|nr:metallophosphoesterase [Termitinemataceae bacterium]HOM23835.1 metallophosphoesterase [Termitinemataceae bacterium]HPP99901.1 metallophosphoesterase [Termitinemataceae bacterium]